MGYRTPKYFKDWDEIPLEMTTAHLALLFQISENTALKIMASKGFPSYKNEGSWRVEKCDVKQWIESRKQQKQ